MSDQYLMSIDIGTTGIKAALYNDLACYVDGAYVEQPLTCERPGWAEQDPRPGGKGLLPQRGRYWSSQNWIQAASWP
jgi:glycerol kinase